MRVLITNDDGIQAMGLNALRTELRKIPELEVHVIAPDSTSVGDSLRRRLQRLRDRRHPR